MYFFPATELTSKSRKVKRGNRKKREERVYSPNPWCRRQILLLMEEILHHLGCIKPCKYLDKLPTNWCRISSIKSGCSSVFTFPSFCPSQIRLNMSSESGISLWSNPINPLNIREGSGFLGYPLLLRCVFLVDLRHGINRFFDLNLHGTLFLIQVTGILYQQLYHWTKHKDHQTFQVPKMEESSPI